MSNTPSDTFSIRIIKAAFVSAVPRWHYPLASNPAWRFYWNRDPGAWIICRGKKIILTPDIALLIPPQTPFATGSSELFGHFYIHFSLLDDVVSRREIQIFPAASVILPYISDHIADLSEHQLYRAAASVINGALLQLPEEYFLPDFEAEDHNIFNKAVKIIDEAPEFSGSCDELAKLCGTSVNTLQRAFHKAAGVPVKKWLLRRKMELAVQLLIYNGCSIKESADRLNFADRYHFSKVFKNYFGISPARFVRSGGIPLP